MVNALQRPHPRRRSDGRDRGDDHPPPRGQASTRRSTAYPSSLMIVPVPVLREMGGPVEPDSASVNDSLASAAVSPYTFTKIVAEVTPAGIVSVPARAS